MYDASDAMASPNANDGARDLLMRLYREIGISAVAAALEASRLPNRPDELKSQENRSTSTM